MQGGFVRVRLDDQLEAWVGSGELLALPPGAASPRRIAGNARLVSAPEWVDLIIPMPERPPYLVNEHPNALELTLYSTVLNTDIVHYASSDSLVRLVTAEQTLSDRAKYLVQLSEPPFGYLVFWRPGELVLRVRRPPAINRDRPLSGLTIAVDAGHPPAGATGPTGLYEAEPTLEISRRVRAMLESRGATVYMTRNSADPLALGDRPVMARRANAHALVSIHLNALPDGINPYTSQGTGTYFFHPQAAPLARAVQREMVRRMGLPDRGVFYDNLALARPTWMPAILCEGAFIMMPRQEAALRTPEFQEAYAQGVADGIEKYFRGLAGRER
jgi:N-acetylmuramoyl-L-alanine amidase